MLRLLHTSDWHLGHQLWEQSREYEHEQFLSWLSDTIESEEVDALIIAGDVFDTVNPPVSAERAYYRFLAGLRTRCPELDIIVIGGNHDSAQRLDAPQPLFGALKVHVAGGLTRSAGQIQTERHLVPLHDKSGEVAAWLVATPFLRPPDLPPCAEATDPLIEGVRQVYAELIDAAMERRGKGQALIGSGHCYMTGSEISAMSERRILGGNEHALPADIFPESMAYVALGHLHKAQRIAKRESLRYSGSPIPLSFSEASYKHQVLIADIEGEEMVALRSLQVPRSVDMIRIAAAPLDEVLGRLAELEPLEDKKDPARPFLDVVVALDEPVADLRARIEDAVVDKRARLLRIGVEYTGTGQTLADSAADIRLAELRPEQVFRRRYERDFEGELPEALAAAFDELVSAVQEGREP